MKKAIVTILLALTVVLFASFRDIPQGHWAKPFVDRLVGLGVVTGFPDGTYRGDESVTRYQAALLLCRTIDYLLSTIEPTVKAVDTLSSEIAAIRRLLNDVVGKTDGQVQNLGKITGDLAKLESQLQNLRKNLDDLSDRLKKLESDVEGLTVQMQDVNLTLELHESDIIKLYELYSALQELLETSLTELKSDFESYAISSQAEFESSLHGLREMLTEAIMGQAEELKNLADRVESIENELCTLTSLLAVEMGAIQGLLQEISENLRESQHAAMAYADALFDDVKRSIETLETDILNIKNILADGLPALKTLIYSVSEEIKTVENRLKEYTNVTVEQAYGDLGAQVEGVKSELESVKMYLEILENRLSLAEEKITELRLDLKQALDETRETFGASLTELKNYLATFEEVTSANIETLAGIVGDHGVAIDELKGFVSKLSKQLPELQDKFLVFENSVTKLSELLNTTIERVDSHDKEIAALKEKIASNYETFGNKLDKLSESMINLEKENKASLDGLKKDIDKQMADTKQELNKTKEDLAATNTLAIWALVIGLVGLAIGVYAVFFK